MHTIREDKKKLWSVLFISRGEEMVICRGIRDADDAVSIANWLNGGPKPSINIQAIFNETVERRR